MSDNNKAKKELAEGFGCALMLFGVAACILAFSYGFSLLEAATH